jgi:iron complex transport system ATP-binding protein
MIEAMDLGRRAPTGGWLWRELDLALQRGRTLAVIGRNGVGKTTLIRTLLGLIAPHEGRVRAAGPVGYVPQRSALSFAFTARDVVAMGRVARARLFSGLGAADKRAIDAAFARVGVEHLAERSFQELSGGERQLVLIARAIATECSAIILDEPCAGLDLDRQRRTLTLLRALAQDSGLAVLFSTHDPDHAYAVADDCLLLGANAATEAGATNALLTPERLSALYGVEVDVVDQRRANHTTRHALADLGR